MVWECEERDWPKKKRCSTPSVYNLGKGEDSRLLPGQREERERERGEEERRRELAMQTPLEVNRMEE